MPLLTKVIVIVIGYELMLIETLSMEEVISKKFVQNRVIARG